MLDYDKMVNGLQQLLDGEIPLRGAGICANLKGLVEFPSDPLYDFIYKMAKQWDKFSGNKDYPIIDLSKQSPAENQFYINIRGGKLWQGTQGELRRELIQFMLDNPDLLRNAIDEVNSSL